MKQCFKWSLPGAENNPHFISSGESKFDSKETANAVSTAEHVQPRNVMQETKSSNVESCPIYVTLIHMHTYTLLFAEL